MADATTKLSGRFQKALKPGALESWEERGSCIFAKFRQSDLLAACKMCMAIGAVFDSAFISSKKGGSFSVYYLFRYAGKMIVFQGQGKEFAALSASVPSALWDERKMQDIAGIKLQGIPDPRPLIFHPESGMPASYPVGGKTYEKPQSGEYPIKGTGMEGEFEIAVGPVHAGIIEPGHFRFHVLGEKINKLEVRMFYLHRGVEKALENKDAAEVMPMIEQISGDESVSNGVAYCHAVESALSLEVPERAEFIRAILMELERIYSHLSDLGGMPTDVGFTLSASRFAVLREDMMRLNQQLCGNRFLRGMCVVGGVKADLQKEKLTMIATSLERFDKQLNGLEHMTLTNSTYLDRVFSTGKLSHHIAEELALTGPVARACGVRCDLRKSLPYSVYETAPFEECVEKTGDVLARYLVKIAEVKGSVLLVKWLAAHMPSGEILCEYKTPPKEERIGIGWTEAPRGGCAFLVELTEEGKTRRVACRTPSFRNWRGIERAGPGNIVPDFPLINKSFNMSYAGTDL